MFLDDVEFEVGRPAGIKPGTPLELPLAVNSGPLPLEPGGRYEWRLSIDGEGDEDWRLAFSVRMEEEPSLALYTGAADGPRARPAGAGQAAVRRADVVARPEAADGAPLGVRLEPLLDQLADHRHERRMRSRARRRARVQAELGRGLAASTSRSNSTSRWSETKPTGETTTSVDAARGDGAQVVAGRPARATAPAAGRCGSGRRRRVSATPTASATSRAVSRSWSS